MPLLLSNWLVLTLDAGFVLSYHLTRGKPQKQRNLLRSPNQKPCNPTSMSDCLHSFTENRAGEREQVAYNIYFWLVVDKPAGRGDGNGIKMSIGIGYRNRRFPFVARHIFL